MASTLLPELRASMVKTFTGAKKRNPQAAFFYVLKVLVSALSRGS
jgi:hypothetical protein